MRTYWVNVLEVQGFPDGPQTLTFGVRAPNYGEAVIQVATYLKLEQIPYKAFAGSRDLGR